jgi:thioredoxin reductase
MHSELEITRERKYAMPESVPCVVIVGGGFAGLAAATALKKAAVRIILIDRTNHHLFQPVNTGDCPFSCTSISTTCHGRGFEQMNSQYERTQ